MKSKIDCDFEFLKECQKLIGSLYVDKNTLLGQLPKYRQKLNDRLSNIIATECSLSDEVRNTAKEMLIFYQLINYYFRNDPDVLFEIQNSFFHDSRQIAQSFDVNDEFKGRITLGLFDYSKEEFRKKKMFFPDDEKMIIQDICSKIQQFKKVKSLSDYNNKIRIVGKENTLETAAQFGMLKYIVTKDVPSLSKYYRRKSE